MRYRLKGEPAHINDLSRSTVPMINHVHLLRDQLQTPYGRLAPCLTRLHMADTSANATA
jgi:hypothetical protein